MACTCCLGCSSSKASSQNSGPLSKKAPGSGEEKARISIHTTKSELYSVEDTEITLPDLFEQGRKITGDGPFLGTNVEGIYSFISYNEADTIRRQIGSALIHRGLIKGDMVGISSQNTTEWCLLALGCDTQTMPMVPLYDTLGEQGVKYILNQTELRILLAHPATLPNYIKYLPDTPFVKMLVKLPDSAGQDTCSEEEVNAARENEVEIVSWTEFLGSGQLHMCEPNFPTPDDVCTLCYTSGTTGFPKGAMLTHRSLSVTQEAVMCHLRDDRIVTSDVHMSYLPAAHILERLVQTAVIAAGASIGFWQGDVKKLATDMQALKPSVFPAVPRILNKLYDKVMLEVSGSKIKSFVFNCALNSKLKGVESGVVTKSSLWDLIIFKKIRNMLGGNIRLMAVGAAPIKPNILQFFRAALGAAVFEGYGQTESSGACSVTHFADYSTGHVGGPIGCCQIKLVDVEDKGYFASQNKGEICLKGLNVFSGYYKDEEKTKEAIDSNGWLHTGDIGEWTPNYGLRLIDRKKNIFKISQGEYIAPEKIELLFERSPLVGQCLVYGDSLKSSLVAIIVPEELAAKGWAQDRGISGTLEKLCQLDELRDEILKQINENGKEGGLKGFEFAKKIHLAHEAFSVENDLSTPTFKLKRHNIAKQYKADIDMMYEELE